MKKVHTLFERDPETHRVINKVAPGLEWVKEGRAFATIKIDGEACMIKNRCMFRRYDRREKSRPAPDGWEPCQPSPKNGHWPGWMPVSDERPMDKHHLSVTRALLLSKGWVGIDQPVKPDRVVVPDGTYELVGPKIQGNPYNLSDHRLVQHLALPIENAPTDFDSIRYYLEGAKIEGIVWHKEQTVFKNDLHVFDMAKIKARDFGLPWPTPGIRL